MEKAWKFGMDDAGNPIHNEDLPSGKLLGLIEDRYRVFHVTDSVQQRDRRCVLGAQQSDGAQIQRLLSARQSRAEFFQSGRKELRALTLQIGARVLRHQEKQHLRILRWRHAVDRFKIFEFWAWRCGRAGSALSCSKDAVQSDKGCSS